MAALNRLALSELSILDWWIWIIDCRRLWWFIYIWNIESSRSFPCHHSLSLKAFLIILIPSILDPRCRHMRLTKASHQLLVSALERDHVHVQAYHYRFVQEHADALLHEVGQGLNELPVPLPPLLLTLTNLYLPSPRTLSRKPNPTSAMKTIFQFSSTPQQFWGPLCGTGPDLDPVEQV